MSPTAIQSYVQKLYQSVLMRDGEAAGVSSWADRAVKGLTSVDMAQNFIVSTEAQNIVAVLRLYDVFFDRAADKGGLSYWLKLVQSGGSIRDVALAFSQSSEYQTKHANSSTGEFVETLYGNLLERSSDADGKANWINLIDSGKMSRAEVALAFTLSDEAVAFNGAATRFAESYLTLRSAGTEQPSTAAVEALAQKSLEDAIRNVHTIHGTVQNGVIQNARVFRDSNGDGLPDVGASVVTTDAKGKFTLVGGYGDIVVRGGEDITTGKVNDKVLSTTITGAVTSVMVTPLTSVIRAIVNQGVNVTDAVRKVSMALGLDAGIDLLSFNHTGMLAGHR